MKAFLDISRLFLGICRFPAIPCSVVGVLGLMMIFIPNAFGTLPADYFVCHN